MSVLRALLVNRYTLTFGTIGLVVLAWNLYVAAHDEGILEGRVVGPDGAPVEGAEVVLAERGVVSLIPIGRTTSAADGRFRFERHDRHALALTASREGLGRSPRLEVRLWFKNQNRVLEEPLRLLP
jgi:hypothetical protein